MSTDKVIPKIRLGCIRTPPGLAECIVATLCLVWSVHRAITQSITLDEANTILFWVLPNAPTHWNGHSNNHILNSALMRLSVWLFGPSHLSFRLPALFGAAIYLAAMASLIGTEARSFSHRLCLAISVMVNPFFMDYYVAARGYSLSLGFTAVALVILSATVTKNAVSICRCFLLSVALALSFCANFASLYLNFCILGAFCFWVFAPSRRTLKEQWALLLWATIPGIGLTFLIAGEALASYSRGSLIWGATSVATMMRELLHATFQILNPYLIHPLAASPLQKFKRLVPAAILLLLFLFAWHFGGHWRKTKRTGQIAQFRFPITLLVIVSIALCAHIVQFRLLGIPLPFERTSIFFVPLFSLGFLLYGMRVQGSFLAHLTRQLTLIFSAVTALYFVGCVRDDYFREWSICADIRAAYPTIEAECKRLDCGRVISDLNYVPSLNVYRVLNHTTEFPEIRGEKIEAGHKVYVLPVDEHRALIEAEGLKVVFAGVKSGFAVLVKDEDRK